MGCEEDGEERETREAKADGKMDERWRRGQWDPYTTNDRNEMAGEERVLPEEVARRTTVRSSEWVVPGFGWRFFLPRWIGRDWNELMSIHFVAKYANLHRHGWTPSRAFSSPRGRDSDSIPVNPCLSKQSLRGIK
jgi:hypothetical protein